MNLFLDANIIVSVVNKEYPIFTYSARVLGLTEDKRFQLYTTPLSLAIAFYFSSKKSGQDAAKKKMQFLSQKLKIAESKQDDIYEAAHNKKIHDFEDGLQYYAAVRAGCKCIITEDTDDFYFSGIEVLNSEAFLKKYVFS